MTVLFNKKTNKYEVRCYYKDILGNTKQKPNEDLLVKEQLENGKKNLKCKQI